MSRLHRLPLAVFLLATCCALAPAVATPPPAAAAPAVAPPSPTAADDPAPGEATAAPAAAPAADEPDAQAAADPAAAPDEPPRAPGELAPRHRAWLEEEVAILISKEERKAFLALKEDYQRDAFIERFWRVRDPYPDTARNERRERWESMMAEAKSRFGSLEDERAKVLLLNGPPAGAVSSSCRKLWPLEVWFYRGSDQMPGEFYVIFYQRWGLGRWRIWEPGEGLGALGQFATAETRSANPGQLLSEVATTCRDGEVIAGAIARVLNQGAMDYASTMSRILETPKPPSGEWASGFAAYTTDIPEDAQPLDVSLEASFPSRFQSRTVLQAVVGVVAASAGQAELAGVKSFNFLLTGEVVRGRTLFESFRYKYDFAEGSVSGERIPLVFERYLRPGRYRLVVRVEDTNGKRFARRELELEVPQLDGMPPPQPADPETAALLAEATAAIDTGDTTIQLVQPRGEMLVGMNRFDTLSTGSEIAEVSFALDGREVLRKNRPPFSVELDLGAIPRTHELVAAARDAAGKELARDSLVLNSGAHRFRIDLTEPEAGKRYERSLRAVAEVEIPEGQSLEKVELYFNETLQATLFGEPFAQPMVLPEVEGLGYVRAVAYLADGNTTEDVVFVNAPDLGEELEVQMVEVYASVLDSAGRPVDGLGEDELTVYEDGVAQEIRRFERVEDLPVHVGALLDVSASMEPNLAEAQRAAVGFFQSILRPRDRAAVVTFNDYPNLAVKFTNDLAELTGGLAGLKAERGTALWDSLVFTLFYFNGIKGQRAIVVLSDGKDEASRFGFEQALEFAQRAGVAIYTIGLDIPFKHLEARRQLAKLAEQTGGRNFMVETAAELEPLYRDIEKELRSRYLLAYQSPSTAANRGQFRAIEVKSSRRGVEVRAMRGYYR